MFNESTKCQQEYGKFDLLQIASRNVKEHSCHSQLIAVSYRNKCVPIIKLKKITLWH